MSDSKLTIQNWAGLQNETAWVMQLREDARADMKRLVGLRVWPEAYVDEGVLVEVDWDDRLHLMIESGATQREIFLPVESIRVSGHRIHWNNAGANLAVQVTIEDDEGFQGGNLGKSWLR